MQREMRSGIIINTFNSLPIERLTHAVFDRTGGVSPSPYKSLNMSTSAGDKLENVIENRRRALIAVGLGSAKTTLVSQMHGIQTIAINESTDLPSTRADALITSAPGIPLFMSFADCVPILLYDPVKHAAGIAHAGWKGTVKGMAQHIVHEMVRNFSCRPADIIAAIGPSISVHRYPVGPEVVSQVQHAFPTRHDLLPDYNNSVHFDLWGANADALFQCGIKSIEISNLCTAGHTEKFYSHRAESGLTGRFGVVIALN